jgi:predicted DNA-binding transcriptional regulator YafY
VPVVAERGVTGGFALLEGWRTRLTGLTPIEATVMSSLPQTWQADARRVASRFHLDPVGWYRAPARADHLEAVANAAWNERRLKVRYDSWKGISDRRIDPLGLVLKGGEWYVVAVSGRGPRRTRCRTSSAWRQRASRSSVPRASTCRDTGTNRSSASRRGCIDRPRRCAPRRPD